MRCRAARMDSRVTGLSGMRAAILIASGAPFATAMINLMPAAAQPATAPSPAESTAPGEPARKKNKNRRGKWSHRFAITFVALLILLVAARMALPGYLRGYVNRTIDQNPLYEGEIGQLEIHLYRGAYTINDVRLLKRTGNVPVPLFAAKKVDLAIEWEALRHGKLVGRVKFEQPQLNFVDSGGTDDSQSQTGAGGPWL